MDQPPWSPGPPVQISPPRLLHAAPLCPGGGTLGTWTLPSVPLCCSQVWGNLSECVCEAAYHTQQVFPAHGDGFSGFLPALEAAEQVSGALSPSTGWVGGLGSGSADGTRAGLGFPQSPAGSAEYLQGEASNGHRDHQSQGKGLAVDVPRVGTRPEPSEEAGGFSPRRTLHLCWRRCKGLLFLLVLPTDYWLWFCTPRGSRS